MKKILFILLCFGSLVLSAQEPKSFFGKKVFDDSVYFNPAKIPYFHGAGGVHLFLDTVSGSSTYGKLVRKVAASGGGGTWGSITGTLSSQTDLQSALDGKASLTGNQNIGGIKTFTSAIQADQYVEWKSGTGSVMGVLGNRSAGADDYGAIQLSNDVNANIVTLSILTPTANRNINLPDASGTLALTSDLTGTYQTLANLSTNTSLGTSNTLYPSQLAVKTYVDNTASAIKLKDAVRVATTTAGTLASSFENGDAIDGITLATGNRILIKDQASTSENGIYTVNASGAPTRATDFDVAAEIQVGSETFVQSGTVNSGRKYTQTATVTTVNTDPITFVQTGGASGTAWGAITGTLADQTDLNSALNGKQAADADLTTYAGITPSANVQTMLGSADNSAIRSNIGLAIGTNVQAFDADLSTYAGITPSSNVQTLLGAADYAAFKTSLSLNNVDNTSDATKNSATATLTNKRITKRSGTVASSATPTINTDNVDLFTITALTVAITSMSTNLSGTPVEGDYLEIWITGTASRAITWGASFADGTVALPTTTSGTLTMMVLLQRKGSLWICKAAASSSN